MPRRNGGTEYHILSRLRVGLGILSGRIAAESITPAELSEMGYDGVWDKDFQRPTIDQLRKDAEEVAMAAFERLFDHTDAEKWSG